MTDERLLERVLERLDAFAAGDAGAVLDPGALADLDRLWRASARDGGWPLPVISARAWLHLYRYRADERLRDDLDAAVSLFTVLARTDPRLVPEEIRQQLGAASGPEAIALLRRGLGGDAAALDRAVELLRAGTNEDAAARARRLANLGVALLVRFERGGAAADVDDSVTACRQALDSADPGDPGRAGYLSGLANALAARSGLGDDAALDEAVALARQAADTVSDADPDAVSIRANHAAVLQRRYDRDHDAADLDEAIAVFETAMAAAAPGHPEYTGFASGLGVCLMRRFDLRDEADDLRRVVALTRILAESPPGPDLEALLSGTTTALLRWFDRVGDGTDLDAAIAVAEEFTAMVPPDFGTLAPLLHELSMLRHHRFQLRGDDADLHEGIRLNRQVLTIAPTSGDDHVVYTSDLGGKLRIRFERLGDSTDVDEAIRLGRAAITDLTASADSRAVALSRLAGSLHARFTRFGDDADLDEAIAMARRAITVAPNHLDHALHLSNLSSSLAERFDQAANACDAEEAIGFARAALETVAPTDPQRGIYASNLGNILALRFQRYRDRHDIDAAIDALRDSVADLPDDHANRGRCQTNLALALRQRFELDGDVADLDEIIPVAGAAAASASAGPAERVRSARYAARARVQRAQLDAETADPATASALVAAGFADALRLYESAIELLPLLVGGGIASGDQQHRLELNSRSLGRDAAAAAIACGDVELAVRIAEQGRGVMWGQLLGRRTDLAALRSGYPDLAAEFEYLHAAAGAGGASRHEFGAPSGDTRDADRADATRRLAALVDRVRSSPPRGDLRRPDEFLRPPSLSRLLPPAHSGPVVIVNVSTWRCDALIVTDTGVRPVPLPITSQDVHDQVNRYLAALHTYRLPGNTVPLEMAVRPVLEWLWDKVCEPVLDTVFGPGVPSGPPPRLWWCPTGGLTLLPLHAAGHHTRANGRTVIDRVVSSYTPTLLALANARTAATPDSPRRMLVVAIPDTPGDAGRALPGAAAEAELLRAAFGESTRTMLTGAQATREAILAELPRHAWAHIACHGTQDLARPTTGGLLPHDWGEGGLIGLDDLAAVEPGRFAFVSACHTATGGVVVLDESVNLAAALQYAGWRHVIGTLWTIEDTAAVRVAESVYGRLVGAGGLEPAAAARALHAAMVALRDDQPGNTGRWARFVHFGP